jgi:hypothetical protein
VSLSVKRPFEDPPALGSLQIQPALCQCSFAGSAWARNLYETIASHQVVIQFSQFYGSSDEGFFRELPCLDPQILCELGFSPDDTIQRHGLSSRFNFNVGAFPKVFRRQPDIEGFLTSFDTLRLGNGLEPATAFWPGTEKHSHPCHSFSLRQLTANSVT